MSIRSEIRSRFARFADALADELEELVQREALALVTQTLERRGAGSTAVRAPPTRRRPGPTRRRRSAGELDGAAGKILAYVTVHPDQRAEVVRAAVGIGKPVWTRAIAVLVKDRKLKKSGERRATTLRRA